MDTHTINLLSDSVTESEITSILETSGRPRLLPPIDGTEWSQIAANPLVQAYFAPTLQLAHDEADVELPVLTDDLYAEYGRTGNRLRFETVYFERRRRLGRAAIAVLIGGPEVRSAAVESFIAKLHSVFNEESWALPAHVAAASGKDSRHIDLFAAESANLFGEILNVFDSLLDPTFTSEVKRRLRSDIFENFADHEDRFFWTKCTNNWNAVCHQGVIGSALAVEPDNLLVARMLMNARANLPYFLSGFGRDGACSEGPGYWSYGFGWFTALNEQLEMASGNRLSLFEGSEHVKEIARYASRVSFMNGYVVNFSDSSDRLEIRPHLLKYLGSRLGDDDLASMGDAAYAATIEDGPTLQEERSDFFRFAHLLKAFPSEIAAKPYSLIGDTFFEDLGVIVARRYDDVGNQWEFAAKAGHNGEHHNHNDCGSYLLNINGNPIFTEIGAPEYTRSFFGPLRYENLAARTMGHSLPVVNGYEQAEGAGFKSYVKKQSITEDSVHFVVDLTHTYPVTAGIIKLLRTFQLTSCPGSLTVTDDFELAEPGTFETALVTSQDVVVENNKATITSGWVQVAIDLLVEGTVSLPSRLEYSDHDGQAAFINRVSVRPKLSTKSGQIAYKVTINGPSHQ